MSRVFVKPFVEDSELIGQLISAVVDPNLQRNNTGSMQDISSSDPR
jgi:hypothetical protein